MWWHSEACQIKTMCAQSLMCYSVCSVNYWAIQRKEHILSILIQFFFCVKEWKSNERIMNFMLLSEWIWWSLDLTLVYFAPTPAYRPILQLYYMLLRCFFVRICEFWGQIFRIHSGTWEVLYQAFIMSSSLERSTDEISPFCVPMTNDSGLWVRYSLSTKR